MSSHNERIINRLRDLAQEQEVDLNGCDDKPHKMIETLSLTQEQINEVVEQTHRANPENAYHEVTAFDMLRTARRAASEKFGTVKSTEDAPAEEAA